MVRGMTANSNFEFYNVFIRPYIYGGHLNRANIIGPPSFVFLYGAICRTPKADQTGLLRDKAEANEGLVCVLQ